jgi:hypothetical protein
MRRYGEIDFDWGRGAEAEVSAQPAAIPPAAQEDIRMEADCSPQIGPAHDIEGGALAIDEDPAPLLAQHSPGRSPITSLEGGTLAQVY